MTQQHGVKRKLKVKKPKCFEPAEWRREDILRQLLSSKSLLTVSVHSKLPMHCNCLQKWDFPYSLFSI